MSPQPWAAPCYHTMAYSELGCTSGGLARCACSLTCMSGGAMRVFTHLHSSNCASRAVHACQPAIHAAQFSSPLCPPPPLGCQASKVGDLCSKGLTHFHLALFWEAFLNQTTSSAFSTETHVQLWLKLWKLVREKYILRLLLTKADFSSSLIQPRFVFHPAYCMLPSNYQTTGFGLLCCIPQPVIEGRTKNYPVAFWPMMTMCADLDSSLLYLHI